MNPEKEKLLSKTYEKFVKVCMNKLPPEMLDEIVAENITGYGTAIDEKILSISDSRDLLNRQMEQLTGMELNYEIIPGHRRTSPDEDSVLIVDELKIKIKSEAYTHKLFVRITTVMEFMDGKWITVHFHSSKPDDTKGETDTWYINEWKRKNEVLQKLVDEKTTDLLVKNRDLEIEASLERVRSIAMGMRESADLLNVCEILFNELKILGFDELRNTMINIHNDEEETFVNYDYSDTLGKTITPLFYNINPVIAKQIKQIRKGKDAFSETSFKGNELKEWKKFRKRKGEPDDPRLKNTKALYYYFYSIGTGSIGISTFGSVTKEKLELLKRFRNVFEFAYRRYMDVTQAEAQAKEAKLEASLERVRAQAMGINKSEQLGNISEIIFTELKALGFTDLRNAEIIINSDKKESVISYYYSDYGVTETIEIFYNTHPKVKKWAEEMRKADDAFTSVEFGEDEIAAWRKYREEIGYLPDPKLNKAKAVYYYSYSIGPGALSISAFKQINDEQLKILERFKNVFGLAYRRYADVALAEAQAGEAKLEASLERVRTHSMVMKKPDDLIKVCESLFNELKNLGFMNLRNSQIVVFNDDNKSFLNYDYSDYAGANTTTILNNSHPLIQSFLIKIKKSKEAFAEFSMELKDWKKFRKKNGELPDPKLDKAAFIYYYFYSIGAGAIGISAFASITKEELEILKRFRNVFEFAYGKYSDVTKAEAQAREAQIELSLERVRARSMAMHRSDELVDASIVLFNELKSLGIESIRTGVGIFDETKKAVEIWSSQLIKEKRNKILGVVPFKAHPFFELNYKAWKGKEPYYYYEMAGKEVKKYYSIMSSVLSYPEKKEFNPKEIFYTFFFPEGSLNVVSQKNLIDDECNLMLRFAKVFGMIYRRFLDLQKAEAQAREAQIQLALERVRAKAMAMQKSDELIEVSLEIYNQFKHLDSAVGGLSINIVNEKERVFEVSFGKFNQSFKLSIDEQTVMSKAYKSWKSGKKSLEIKLSLKDIIKFNKIRNKAIGSEIFPEKYKSGAQLILYLAFFSKGMLIVGMNEHRPKETIDILQRFASVFDLTYTRFLDLQKAEAQAREAQIELALERVRARTMAMHSSDELQEAAILLFQQISELGVDTGSCGYVIWENENKDATVWMSSAEGGIQDPFKLPHTKSKIYKEIYSAKEEGKEFFVKEVSGAELKKHFDYLTTVPGIDEKIKQLRKARYKFPETIVYNTAFFKQGYLSFHTHKQIPDAQDIFRRFANVFEQTYTRFLDLQKAEAQAREAQIELGLERVRTRAMAMQKSDELSELVDTVFKELTKLDFALTWCIINIIDESSMSNTVWAANPDINKAPESYHMLFEDYPFHHAMMKGWKGRKAKDVYVLGGQEKKIYDDYLFNETEFRRVPAAAQAVSRAMEKYVVTFSFSNFGGLQTVGDEPLSEANGDILSRFGKVFDLTYTRFNDLKLAEAQATESKIEAALERVRSRTMGMQKSVELKEVIQVVLEQFVNLNINAEHAGFVMDYKARDDYNIWVADPLGVPSEITIPYFDSVYYNRFNEAKDRGEDFFAINLSFKEKNIFYKKLFKYIPALSEEAKKFYFSCPGLAASTVLLDNVSLYIENFSGIPYSDEENITLMRFGKVFQQTYTRFLDLQKAEAQAREAQIELGLERVRARAMAMQNSDELKELIGTVFIELTKLDLVLTRCHIMIYDPKTNGSTWWMANSEAPVDPIGLYIKYHEHAPYLAYINAWQERNLIWQYILEGKDKKEWDDFLFRETELSQLPNFVKAGMIAPDRVYLSASFNNFGCLNLASLDPLSNEHSDILLRFGKVFDLTYTRFNDLQKAEAQAREAQIEAALEKVRGKAMAMHNSADLTDAAGQVFTELNNLGIKPIRSGFVLLTKESRKAKLYPATSFDNKNIISFTGEFEFTGHPVYEMQYESWKKNDNYFPVLEGDLLKSYYKILAKGLSVPYKNFLTKNKKQFGTFLPFKEGFLFTWSDEAYSETEINILDRFKAILDLTIRRYLDLQKAEAQTREAQIEAGLERVRSRAMAMHKTDELLDAAELVYKEISALGITSMNVSYSFLNKEEKYASYYSVNPVDGKTVPFPFVFPHTETEVMRSILSSWKKQESFNVIDLDEKATLKHQTWAGEHIQTQITKNNINIPFSLETFLAISPKTAVIYTFNFSKGYLFVIGETLLTKMQEELLLRFTKVFEQAYIRFLDLQKAEAQAREAKIEAALERTRTQSMIMQHSKELDNTLRVFHEQVLLLGIPSAFSFLWLPDEKNDRHIFWAAWKENGNDSTVFKSKAINYPLDRTEPATAQCFVDWKGNEPIVSYHVPPQGIENYFAAWQELLDGAEQLKPEYFSGGLYYVEAFMKYGCFGVIVEDDLKEDEKKILGRFAIEFERTYRRFLDLQKAEEQAREAQIEASLERVRSKTMAMHNSPEVGETVAVMFDELRKLGIETYRCGIGIMDEAKEMEVWTAKPDDKGKVELIVGHLDMNMHPLLTGAFDYWKNKKDSYYYHLKGKDLIDYFNAINMHEEYPVKYDFDSLPGEIFHHDFYFREGTLFIFTLINLSSEDESTLKRFAGIFGQTYRRYLDLQKAEAQAREATIEASLERVRSKAMAMHSSEDLASTVNIFFKELKTLGIIPLRCGVSQADLQKKSAYVTATTAGHQGNSQEVIGELDLTRHTILEDVFHHWQMQKEYYTILTGKELKEYYKAMSPQVVFPDYPEEAVQYGNYFTFKEGWVYAWTEKELSEEERKIFRRYTSVISLTYRRFMDLKEAEAQAREAQIEASLERVRSRAMAMQKSDDLGMAVATIFEELDKLDLGALRCGIGIIDKAKKSVDVWATAISDGKKTVQVSGDESMDSHPLLKGAYDAWMRQEDFSYLLQGDDLKKYYEVQLESNFKLPDSQLMLSGTEELKQYYYVAVFQAGGLFALRETEFPDEAKIIIKRFADVINFTYTRFNDLKQAEAQARESQIEVALERVRSRTMAMQRSEELSETAFVLYRQFMELGETPDTITIGIMNETDEVIEFWSTMDSNKTNLAHKFSYTETEVLNQLYRAWKEQKKSFVIEMKGKILREYVNYRIKMTGITTENDFKEDRRIVHAAFFSKGLITITTPDPLSKGTILLLERFAGVFDLTYTRFLDLKQSEAQTKEAQIEVALERVRSRTLAMQKSDELAETAAVVFKQLINLGIAPNRLYIGIIKDDSGEIELWATDEDGSKVSTQFTGNINRNGSIKKMYEGWESHKKSLTIDMHGKELSDYFHYLSDELKVPFKLGLEQKRRVQNIAFFSQGFIGMASPELQPEEAVDLLERFAAVFNLTYTRFNDLKIAEHHAEQAQLDLIKLQTEKKRAEEALTELRSTQTQLIQSEKMASLGELTAGIAHEIQNPLNFVNNFSEVNSELVDELNHELEKGNFEEAVAIAKDIKENEEKIKHHGKRAEGIVKGMLQHSRASSGVKEPTNINTLADEYLRLAYHGLRAKDKTFNAKMKTEFDESLGNINIVPQDIGRVILNLITNAFYAVDEKKKQQINDYEPTVTVITKRENDNVMIAVKDNGNGIPQKVMDKIFQPFFTTKPTGQGTGLGLSMSYDIIKAHGGELRVETKEGEGAEFVILLPL